MENFEAKSILTRELYRELDKLIIWRPFRTLDKVLFTIGLPLSLCLVVMGILGVLDVIIIDNPIRTIVFGIVLIALLSTAFPLQNFIQKIHRNKALRKTKEIIGTEEQEMITTFLEDEVKIYSPQKNGTIYLKYNLFKKFVEAKDTYILITKENQFIVVNKDSLTQEDKNEVFLSYIRDKCKNVKWSK